MPGTLNVVELQAYFAIHGGIWRMAIGDGPPHDKALLITFFAAVHYLLKNPIRYKKGYIVPIPTRDMESEPVHAGFISTRVFKAKGKVWKLFDTYKEKVFLHNADLLKEIGFHHELVPLGNSERFFMLSREYIHGTHEPDHLAYFRGILRMLAKVHRAGYVHGDVRLANMIFAQGGSYLIDFDLARKENQKYPEDMSPL